MITAPFNFVPLNEKVFFPPWAEDVSHDIPFEDAESGTIDITITAKSPIFVRNSSSDRENPSTEFCNHNGQYYIPGSSVKGMVRNVLEIMSFSKLNENLFTDNTYAVRDLSNSKNFYMKQMKELTYAGWLKKSGNEYIIEDCGEPGRIKHNEIDKIFNTNFVSTFKKGNFSDKPEDKTALKKYSIINNQELIHSFTHSKTTTTGEKRYIYDKNSSKKGTIVFTGQPSGRDETEEKPEGKAYEFIFFDKKGELKVSKKVMNNFLFAYFDDRKTQPMESPDWTFWKEKLNSGEKVPVFFQKKGIALLHFGLSFLYKLPYNFSIKDGISKVHIDNPRLDLAQTIFGYINKNSNASLKGRIQFSHFKAIDNVKELDEKIEVLGSPRASYYPIYIRQNSTEFKTYMDSDFKVAGRKRYPIQKGIQTYPLPEDSNGNINMDVVTKFKPLNEGIVFKGKLRYHNLNKVELGAILSAITLHNTPNTFHNIGMAKSLGYGKIDIKLNGIESIDKYLKEFELSISEQILDWKDSEQLKELLSMSVEQNNRGDSKLKYMTLNPSENIDEFSDNKVEGSKDYLKKYTLLQNIKPISIQSLLNEEEFSEVKTKNKEFLRLEELGIEFTKAKSSNTIQALECFIDSYEESKYTDKAKKIIENIKEKEQKAKKQEAQKEEDEKWKSVKNADKKYKKQALKDFINNYSNSKYIDEAKKSLEELDKSTSSDNPSTNVSDILKVTDSKKLKVILEKLTIDETNKEDVKANIVKVYNSLKGNKQKKFFKEAQLGRLLGTDFEAEVKSEVGAK